MYIHPSMMHLLCFLFFFHLISTRLVSFSLLFCSPLFLGQFGSRKEGGKDASAARYIFTRLSFFTRLIFHEADDPLVRSLHEKPTEEERRGRKRRTERKRRRRQQQYTCMSVYRWLHQIRFKGGGRDLSLGWMLFLAYLFFFSIHMACLCIKMFFYLYLSRST